jgi:hypothetical protein
MRELSREVSPWYGANDSGLQTIQLNRCGLCEGDPLMKLTYEGCEVQLVARATTRRIRKMTSHKSR